MKKLLLLFTCFFLALTNIYSQDYYKRAQNNIKYLVKDPYLNDFVKIDEKAVTIYNPAGDPEVKIYWDEAEFFLKILYNKPYHDLLEIYKNKGLKPFPKAIVKKYGWLTIPDKYRFQGLKVAIDPGHFAGNFEQALQEDKYVKMRGKDLGLKKDIQFFESELNYTVAEILKRKLENEGAIVYLSRSWGESAVGLPFDKWYEEQFPRDLAKSVKLGDVSEERAKWLLKASKAQVFFTYYKYLDFVNRSRKINLFDPDISLVIHFNAEEKNQRDEEGYLKPVKDNYSMVFVPGGFVRGELRKLDTRIDFLRLLLSNDLERSIDLANYVVDAHSETLKVPPVSNDEDLTWKEKYAVYSGYQGVYHRNLYLTRALKGVVIYGESLLQDNLEEARNLNKKDLTYFDRKISSRVYDVAEAYFQALEKFLQEKEKKAKEVYTTGN